MLNLSNVIEYCNQNFITNKISSCVQEEKNIHEKYRSLFKACMNYPFCKENDCRRVCTEPKFNLTQVTEFCAAKQEKLIQSVGLVVIAISTLAIVNLIYRSCCSRRNPH